MTSQKTTLAEVYERLIKLEKQNRRMKQIGAVALVVVASVLVMAQALPEKIVMVDEVIANNFVLKDNSGMLRGLFNMHEGIPGLFLYGQDGEERVALSVDKKGTGVVTVAVLVRVVVAEAEVTVVVAAG